MDRNKKPTSKKVKKPNQDEAETKDDGEYDIWDELLAGTANSHGVAAPKPRERARFRPHASTCTEHKCECGVVTEQSPAPGAARPYPGDPLLGNIPISYEDLTAALQNDPQYARLKEDFARLVCLRVAELDPNAAAAAGSQPYPQSHGPPLPPTAAHAVPPTRRPTTPATPIFARSASDPHSLNPTPVPPTIPSLSPVRATTVVPVAASAVGPNPLGCPSPASGRAMPPPVTVPAGAASPPPLGTPRLARTNSSIPDARPPASSAPAPQPPPGTAGAGAQPPPSATPSPSVEALLLPLVDKFLQENLGSLHHMQKGPTPWMRPTGCATIDDEMKWLASQNLTDRPATDRPQCPVPSSADFRSPTSPSYSGVFPYLLPLQSLQPYLQPQYPAGQPGSISHVPYTAVFAPVPIPASEVGASLGQYYAHAAQQQPPQRSRSVSQHASGCPHGGCKVCGHRRHRHHSCRCYPTDLNATPAPSGDKDKRPKKPSRQGPDRSKARPHLKSRCSAFSEAGSTSSSQRGKTDFDSVSPRSSCTSGSLFSRSQSESQPSMSDCTTEGV